MTVIFRQRIFSKRWKIRKDWDVGLHHTTATIVEDKECHCLKSDNKIAECVLSPSDLEWIKEGKMIFINDDLHGSEDGTYYIISKTMHDTNRNTIVYVEDKIEEDSPSMRNKGELENVLLNVNNLEEYKRTHKYKHRFFNFKKG
jgi:hypothetical protein